MLLLPEGAGYQSGCSRRRLLDVGHEGRVGLVPEGHPEEDGGQVMAGAVKIFNRIAPVIVRSSGYEVNQKHANISVRETRVSMRRAKAWSHLGVNTSEGAEYHETRDKSEK